jgi:glycosyltransferase 2 family protein
VKRLRAVLALAVTLGLLGVLWGRLDTQALAETLSHAQLGWLALAAALGPLQVILGAERWCLASERVGAPIERFEAWREYALSTFVNQVLPSGVAGDAARMARQRHHGWKPALLAGLVDRGVGQALLVAVTALGLAFWPARPAGSLVAALVLLGVFVAALAFAPVRQALAGAWLQNALLSGALIVTFLGGFALCSLALGRGPGLWLLVAIPLVLLAMAIPLSLGGWGLREASAAALLPAFGFTPEEAVALAGCYGVTVLVGALPGACVPLWGRRA